MQEEKFYKKYRVLLIAVGTLVLLSGLVFWAYKHSFIEIIASGNTSGTLNYSLLNQKTGKEIAFRSTDTKVKKLVPTGTYEVYVLGDDSSYITTTTTDNFLTTSKVAGTLSKEREREFVGYNPAPCTIYLAGILRSYECSSELNTVNSHVPATLEQPTYTQNAGIDSAAGINGVAYTSFGPVMFTSPVYITDEIFSADYRVGLLNDDLSVGRSIDINYLALGQDYKIKAYLDGFIIYNSELSDLYYYSSLDATPVKLVVGLPDNSNQRTIGLSVNGSSIVRYYSNNLGGEEDTEAAAEDEVLSEIFVYDGKKNTKFSIPKFILGVSVCGDNKLCILSGDSVLTVYTTKDGGLFKDYIYTGVTEIHQRASETYLINAKGILLLDSGSGTGQYVYRFGNYNYCGLQESISGSIVCLIDSTKKKVALNLIAAQPVINLLDKQIDRLSSDDRIENVSVYKTMLFVTPIVAEPNQKVIYSPAQVKRGKQNLEAAIKSSGLEVKGLTLINTTDIP